jgi:putative tricarboxylic transport membrane protein
MTNRMQDTVLAIILLIMAAAWIWLVSTTIRSGFGQGDIGPRAFPLTFGIALAVLTGLLLLRAYLSRDEQNAPAADAGAGQPGQIRWVPALLVLGEISLYGFLLQKTGFLIATPVIVFLIILVNLRVRSLKTLLGMPLGLTLGAWLIFEKLLGIYLANGSWINLG